MGTWHGAPVAVKRIKRGTLSRRTLSEFRDELQLHQELRFPFVVQLLGACTVQPNLCLVMELAPFGSLYELLHLSTSVPLSSPLRLAMLYDVSRGMAYLHGCRVVHRDLKSSNLLIFENRQIRIGDFGLSRVLDPEDCATKQVSVYNQSAILSVRKESLNSRAHRASYTVHVCM
jgi:serine/threonine protein kinase